MIDFLLNFRKDWESKNEMIEGRKNIIMSCCKTNANLLQI